MATSQRPLGLNGSLVLRAVLPSRWVVLGRRLLPRFPARLALEAVAPDYVVADLPIPIVGLVLATVGVTLHRDRGPSVAT